MTRLHRILFCLGLACILAGGEARAHAALVEAVPADGAVVETVPSEVHLRFNEPISPVLVHLVDAKGTQRRDVHFEARGTTLTIQLPTDLPRGTQVVSYRVISSDGHPVGGSLVFSIGTATITPPGEPSRIGWELALVLWLGRLALYFGLFIGVGGTFFAIWIAPNDTPRAAHSVIRTAIGVGVLAAIVSVGLQGLDALDAPLLALFSGPPWAVGVQTSFGLTAGAAVLALLCAWGANKVRRLRYPLSLLGLGGAGLALALSGHASVAEPQWLTRPAVFIHGMAAAFWVGALVPLALVIWEKREASLPIVRRFSAIAVLTVAALVLTGIALGVVQIETPSALATTA
ncbi:copper resistance protein CopC [Microvirga terricola]|uniref:Copper resistance protein CopC/CopD n=1 Tax=Microvirga terricola TaxID=2719797 RepID=A0ABX0VB49_9HYPH|nr:copper resistance protein CopC [Microvirga terricola]NIX75930.1 copper resistance protein CopC/CopD [Microvirga terricola]